VCAEAADVRTFFLFLSAEQGTSRKWLGRTEQGAPPCALGHMAGKFLLRRATVNKKTGPWTEPRYERSVGMQPTFGSNFNAPPLRNVAWISTDCIA
jgi:hypothetical protein